MAEYSSLMTCSNEVFIIGQIFMVECLQLSGLYLLNQRRAQYQISDPRKWHQINGLHTIFEEMMRYYDASVTACL